ncbi:MAG TPA: hypothetical protein VFI87_18240 [Hyphomicrobiaceae bacterium]|nr:hypothetical protein [Hyphomicrobiaceae bacterium]
MNQPTANTWWAPWLDMERFATAALFVVLACVACLMPAQSDTWWQLRTGEDIWRSGRIILHDELTHTVAGRYWPNHEWLTQVVFYGTYRLGGLPLLTAVCAAAVVATWLIVLSLTPGATLLRLMLVFCGAAFSTASWSLRPQVFTSALLATTLWILVRRRFYWMLPPLFLIWANLHGGVAAGGVLIVAAVLSSAILAPRQQTLKLIGIGVLCLAATAATPLGFSLWLEIPTSLGRLKTYGVTEWLSPSLANPVEVPFWMMAIGLCVVVVMRRNALRSLDAATLTLAGMLTLGLALRSARNIPLFFICAVPALATLLHEPAVRPTRQQLPALAAAVLAVWVLVGGTVVAYAWRTRLPGLAWEPLRKETIAAITACEGPLYNRYDEGGYLTWFLKDRKVFIDSRQDPFPREFVLDQLRVEETGDYASTFGRYAISCALTRNGSLLSLRLEQDGWRPHPGAPPWTVYSRPPGARH